MHGFDFLSDQIDGSTFLLLAVLYFLGARLVQGEEKLERLKRGRLAQECAKLEPGFEKALAEEGLSEDLSEWPEY